MPRRTFLAVPLFLAVALITGFFLVVTSMSTFVSAQEEPVAWPKNVLKGSSKDKSRVSTEKETRINVDEKNAYPDESQSSEETIGFTDFQVDETSSAEWEIRRQRMERARETQNIIDRSTDKLSWYSFDHTESASLYQRDDDLWIEGYQPFYMSPPLLAAGKFDESLFRDPPQTNAAYSITLTTVHRNRNSDGSSSTFVFTNTGSTTTDYTLNFFWPNGQFLDSDGPYSLAPGASQSYDLESAPLCCDRFVGQVDILGSEPVTGAITSPEYGIISGYVYENDGTTPVSNVWVAVAIAHDYDWFGGGNSLSDGQYFVGGLPDNNYFANAAPGYPWARQWYQGKDNGSNPDQVSISSAAMVTSVNFILQPGGKITGTVYAADGITPLPNVNLNIHNQWWGSCTDANGNYEFSGVPYGNHIVSAGMSWNHCKNQSGSYITEYYSETYDFDSATPINVNSGNDTVSGIDFTMEEGGSIVGRVISTVDSSPVVNVRVRVDEYPDGNIRRSTQTDASGYYTITGLADGAYRVEANVGYPWARQWYNGKNSGEQAEPVTISGGNTLTGINFALQPGGKITGTVYSVDGVTPLQNVNVDLDQGWWGTCTDANGHYEIDGVPYGDQIIVAGRGWNWCRGMESTYVTEYYSETYYDTSATPIAINSGNDIVPDINFTMEEGGEITGRVTSAADGSPLADVMVYVDSYPEENYNRQTHSDVNGYYTVTGLIDGDYVASVRNPKETPLGYGGQYYNGVLSREDADLLTIAGGNSISNIDFALGPGGSIAGVVTDQVTGFPLANVWVGAGIEGAWFGFGVCTNSQGEYEIQGMPYADYIVYAGGGWNRCQNQPSEYTTEYYNGKAFRQSADLVTIDSGNRYLQGINFDLEKGGFISGTIRDTSSGNDPVVGLHVEARLRSNDCPTCWSEIASAQTDSNGGYLLGPLGSGQYAVFANTDAGNHLLVNEYYNGAYDIQTADLVSVTSEVTTTGIDIYLETGIWITGHVTVPSGYSAQNFDVNVWKWDGIDYTAHRFTDASGDYIVPVPPIYDSYWAVDINPNATDLGAQWAQGFDLNLHTQWDFVLGPGGTITGHITSGGVPLSRIWVNAGSPWQNRGAQTDNQGYYEITNLPPGEYKIEANGDWMGYKRVYYGGHAWGWAIPVNLGVGETVGDVNFDVPELGRLEGYVYESDGVTPIEGVRLTALNDDGFWEGWSQSDGYFSIDLPAGDHKLYIDDESDIYVTEFYSNQTSYQNAVTLTVPTVNASLFVTVTLERWSSLGGQVTDVVTGDPVGGILVSALNIDPLVNLEAVQSTCTDANGDYHLDRLWPGQTEVIALGTCSSADYGVVTATLSLSAGGSHSLNITVQPETGGERPFTVRVNDTFDYTPLTVRGWSNRIDSNAEILPALFTPLVQMNERGEYFSDLLTQVPTEANGGVAVVGGQLYVTYTLKSGLLWSDGAALTSSDIRFAWQMLDIPEPTRKLNNYGARYIEEVLTPDAQTAVIVFEPGYLTANYLDVLVYPLPEHVLAGVHPLDVMFLSDYAHNPVGNGPYIVDKWIPGSHLDLRANPNYHKRSLGLPVIERIRFLFTNDSFEAIASGAADVSLNIPWRDLPSDLTSLDLRFYTGANGSYDNIYFNPETVFFSDPIVRRAMSNALDRESFVQQRGHERIVARSWLSPDHIMYTSTITMYNFDLSAAASLLTAAGWVDTNGDGTRDKNGVEFEFDLYYPDGHEARTALVTMFQQDLETIGVNLNLVPIGWREIINRGWRGELDSFTLGYVGIDRVDPGGYGFFHSNNIPTAYNSYRSYNIGRWDSATNDAWLGAARDELDIPTLKGLYAQQLTLFNDQMPVLPHSHWARHSATVPTLLNFLPQAMTPATWNIETWELPANPYDLAVRKSITLDSPAPQPGNVITYEISVRNAGSLTMTNASLEDTLPSTVSFLEANPAPSSISGSLLTWDLGDLPSDTSQFFVRVAVQILPTVTHGTLLTNTVEVYADQLDTYPGNNRFVHQIEVREDVDLEITKAGIGYPAIGEKFRYVIDYANWGGAPASNVVITDELPSQVSLLNVIPTPSGQNGNILTWTLSTLPGNQWGGQIEIEAEIINSGTVTNTARIATSDQETRYDNNSDDHVDDVIEILPPVILRPTQGTTDQTPTISGLAPSNSIVSVYEVTTPTLPQLLMTTTASVTGTFRVELNLLEGTYFVRAKASKAGLTSDYSNSTTFDVDHNLPLDPDYVEIKADGVDISAGSVRAHKNTLSQRLLEIQARLTCSTLPASHLEVIENGLYYYSLPANSNTSLGGNLWEVAFQFWMSEPQSSYDVWVEWNCGGNTYRENLMYILIDPDGYIFDQSLVDAGSTITDSILLNGVITAYVRIGDDWDVWPAYVYGQSNPQMTDNTTDDGVQDAGYYSFLTPPGQYYLEATAPGYQPFRSEIITVITDVIRLDIGLWPVTGGSGFNSTPVDLRNSQKTVDVASAGEGSVLTYKIVLENSGDADTGVLKLSDYIPTNTTYITTSLTWSSGLGAYISASETISWTGMINGGTSVTITYQVRVNSNIPSLPYDVDNTATVISNDTNLSTLPELSASTQIRVWSSRVYLPLIVR